MPPLSGRELAPVVPALRARWTWRGLAPASRLGESGGKPRAIQGASRSRGRQCHHGRTARPLAHRCLRMPGRSGGRAWFSDVSRAAEPASRLGERGGKPRTGRCSTDAKTLAPPGSGCVPAAVVPAPRSGQVPRGLRKAGLGQTFGFPSGRPRSPDRSPESGVRVTAAGNGDRGGVTPPPGGGCGAFSRPQGTSDQNRCVFSGRFACVTAEQALWTRSRLTKTN